MSKSKLTAALASLTASQVLAVTIQASEEVAKGVFRIVCDLPNIKGLIGKDINKEVASAICTNTGSTSLRYLPGSLVRNGTTFTAFVKGVTPRISKEMASANFKEIALNVFQDADESIWNLEEGSGGAFFVAAEEPDFAHLLDKVRRNITTASMTVAMEEPFQAGSVVSFYDPTRECRLSGIAVTASTAASPVVYVPSLNAVVDTNAKFVCAVYEGSRLPIKETAGKASDVISYMKELYSYNKEFVDALTSLIDDNLAV